MEAAFSQCGRSSGGGHQDRGGWCRMGKGSAGLGRQVRRASSPSVAGEAARAFAAGYGLLLL